MELAKEKFSDEDILKEESEVNEARKHSGLIGNVDFMKIHLCQDDQDPCPMRKLLPARPIRRCSSGCQLSLTELTTG